MKKVLALLISLCLLYSCALADEAAAAVAEEASAASSALSLVITFLPLLLILGFVAAIVVIIVMVTKNNNKKAAQRAMQQHRPPQITNCCVCGRSLSEGYANLFTDQYGYEARVCETCWHAVNTVKNAASEVEREDAAEYLREKLPGVAPAIAEYLKMRIGV